MKQLLIEAIKKLSERGANVVALVFDAAPKNLGMAEKLGCDIRNLDGLMIICEVFKNFAKTLQSFFNQSNTELKTVQCTVKRLNLRKLCEIRNFQNNFANYQLAPRIDDLRRFFETAKNWSAAKVEALWIPRTL